MRWIHISDMHFGYNAATIKTMRKKLLEKVQEIEQVDCLFITGDLRYAKNEQTAYPSETLEFILNLQSVLNIKPEDTFVVPGNHDINRGDGALQAIIQSEKSRYSTQTGKIGSDTLDFIMTKRKPFLELYERIRGKEEPSWHYCETKEGFNIICLNTALLCGLDGEDGSLVIGSELLNELAETVDSSKPGIVLAHHDFDSLCQEEQQKLEIILKDMGAKLYLCGHKHVSLSHSQNTYRTNQDLRVFLCGTSMDKDPVLSQTDMDFFVGETTNGCCGWVQAYKWYSRSNVWAPDVEFSISQDGSVDGKYYFPKEFRPEFKPALSKDVQVQYFQYIRQQCSEIEQNGLPMTEEDVSRRYELRRVFIPLKFDKQVGLDEDPHMMSCGQGIERVSKRVNLDQLLPDRDRIRMFILSDAGGGKTTLLKWIASVYCFPEEYKEAEAHLPKREFLPVWLRCRDIPEGSRPTIWKTIQDIALRGEWLPHGSEAADFTALVAHHIARGTMLLLIDGLDEIGSDADRDHFVEQLRSFADLYPSANILVSSRPTGFSLVTQGLFKDFDRAQISLLSEDDVRDLCLKWSVVVRGDSESTRRAVGKLVDSIVSNERIFRLASNPLLLTTLLLVERRVGRLPTKRVELYEEAIRVLLETWNRRGHESHPVDLDEARYQLAYVAFYMTTHQKKRTTQNAQITRSELIKLLKKARKELAELISNTEKPGDFVRNIECRSALLIQKGYGINENGEREAVYEFQHLTFQEYLAAYAVNHDCYPGAKEGDDPISVIKTFLTDKKMREIIPLVAVRLPRYEPKKLVDVILEKMECNDISSDDRLLLRELLIQFVADEVMLPEPKIEQILNVCFRYSVWDSDKELLRQIMEGRNSQKLKKRFTQMDIEQNSGYDEHFSILEIVSGEIADPYHFFKENCCQRTVQEKIKAINVLSNACFWGAINLSEQLTAEEINWVKNTLLGFARNNNEYMRKAALTALRDVLIINTPQDLLEYLSVLTNHINNSDLLPTVIPFYRLPSQEQIVKIGSDMTLSEAAVQRIINKITSSTERQYSELLTLAWFVLVCTRAKDTRTVLAALSKQRDYQASKSSPSNEVLHLMETYFFEMLHDHLLCGNLDQENKRTIQEYMLKTDLMWAQHMKASGDIIYSYTDYSIENADGMNIGQTLMNSEATDFGTSGGITDDVIKHINLRLKSLCLAI